MQNIYDKNGLVLWEEEEIEAREMYIRLIQGSLERFLRTENRAFRFFRVDAPILTPVQLINPNYTSDDYFKASEELALRPETTIGSYKYLEHLLQTRGNVLPCVVWQAGKSFRQEQDHPTAKMKLKEFYQLEFQIFYSLDSKNDYPEQIKPHVHSIIQRITGAEATLVPSDRLPDYSTETIDIEVSGLEICSMSRRKDFEGVANFEVAIGLDRLVYKAS